VEGKQGLKSFEIFLNGGSGSFGRTRYPAGGGKRPRRLNFDRKIQLDEGTNQLRVVVTDVDDLSAKKLFGSNITRSGAMFGRWSLVSMTTRSCEAKYAVNDAQAFYRLLVEENRVPPEM